MSDSFNYNAIHCKVVQCASIAELIMVTASCNSTYHFPLVVKTTWERGKRARARAREERGAEDSMKKDASESILFSAHFQCACVCVSGRNMLGEKKLANRERFTSNTHFHYYELTTCIFDLEVGAPIVLKYFAFVCICCALMCVKTAE